MWKDGTTSIKTTPSCRKHTAERTEEQQERTQEQQKEAEQAEIQKAEEPLGSSGNPILGEKVEEEPEEMPLAQRMETIETLVRREQQMTPASS